MGRFHTRPQRPAVLVATLLFVALVVAAAQWTLTGTLLAGAVAIPLLARLGDGPRRRTTELGSLATVCSPDGPPRGSASA